jgi:hypothetical protein
VSMKCRTTHRFSDHLDDASNAVRGTAVHRIGDRRSYAVAVVAAALLFVHSIALAWNAGAMPLGPMLDQFGNPLCITSGDHDAPAQPHGEVPSCCAIGCMFAASWTAGASGDKPSYLLEIPDHVAANGCPVHQHQDRPEFRQNGPRAPPSDI